MCGWNAGSSASAAAASRIASIAASTSTA